MSFKKTVYNEKNIPILPNQSAGSTSVPICMAVPCGDKSRLLYFCGSGASNMVKKQVHIGYISKTLELTDSTRNGIYFFKVLPVLMIWRTIVLLPAITMVVR